MITEQQSDNELFAKQLETLYKGLPTDSLDKIRAKAWDRYCELGVPTRKNEVYRYVKLRSLFSNHYVTSSAKSATNFAEHILPECKGAVIVFVNGHFMPALSQLTSLPKKAALLPLNEAMKTYGSFIQSQWTKSIKDENDPFAALNSAFHRDGAFFYLPPKSTSETPIQILHLIDNGGAPMTMHPRLQVFVGSQSELEIISTQAILRGEGSWINSCVDLHLEDDAHVNFTQVAMTEPANFWHFEALRATLKRDSVLKTICASDGGTGVRYDYRVALTGENGEAKLNGVYMLKEKNEGHTHVIVDHQSPHCRSMQLFKAVLNDLAHSSFEGKILVRQPAQKTEAFQLNNNLLLSDRAAADSKPNLEIFADDVKASHGATVGQLDKEQLFYMKTRGFSEDQAKNILISGFCKEVLELIKIPSIRDNLISQADRYLTPKGL